MSARGGGRLPVAPASTSFPTAFPYYVPAENLHSFLRLLAQNPLEPFEDAAFMRERLLQIREDIALSTTVALQQKVSDAAAAATPTTSAAAMTNGHAAPQPSTSPSASPPSVPAAAMAALGFPISTSRPLAAQQGIVTIPDDEPPPPADAPTGARRPSLRRPLNSTVSAAAADEGSRKRARRSGRTTSPPAGVGYRVSSPSTKSTSSDDEDAIRVPRAACPEGLANVPDLTDADGVRLEAIAVNEPLCPATKERFKATSACDWVPPVGAQVDAVRVFQQFCIGESLRLRGQDLPPFDHWSLLHLRFRILDGTATATAALEARCREEATQWLRDGPGSHLLFPGELRPWTSEEKVLYERGLFEHGRAFGKIRRSLLPYRTTGQLANFYYQRHKQARLQHGGNKVGHLFDRGTEGCAPPAVDDEAVRRAFLVRSVVTLRQLAQTAGDGFPPDRAMARTVSTFRELVAARSSRRYIAEGGGVWTP